MRSLMIFLTVVAVMGLGFWAYGENYRTQGELAEVRDLQAEIGQLKESLGVLRAEWAYLNRPDRLREPVGAGRQRVRAQLRGGGDPRRVEGVVQLPQRRLGPGRRRA